MANERFIAEFDLTGGRNAELLSALKLAQQEFQRLSDIIDRFKAKAASLNKQILPLSTKLVDTGSLTKAEQKKLGQLVSLRSTIDRETGQLIKSRDNLAGLIQKVAIPVAIDPTALQRAEAAFKDQQARQKRFIAENNRISKEVERDLVERRRAAIARTRQDAIDEVQTRRFQSQRAFAEIQTSRAASRTALANQAELLRSSQSLFRQTSTAVRNFRQAQAELFRSLGDDGKRNFLDRFAAALGIGVGSLAIFAGIRELKSIVRDTIQTAAEFQRLGTSFTSILGQARAEQGDRLTPELLRGLRSESQRLFRESQLAAIETVATTKEYVKVLQTALAVGQQVGLSQRQIEIITKRFVLAAGAFGIEMSDLGSSVSQILTGTVRVTNQLGRSLGFATKEQREQLKVSIQQGTLFDFLEKKTAAFAATADEVANNFLNVRAAVQDIFEIGGTQAFRPLFEFLNQALIQIRDTFISSDINAPLKPALQRIIKDVEAFFIAIIPNIKLFFNEVIGLGNDLFDIFIKTPGEVKFLINLFANLVGALRTILVALSGIPGKILLFVAISVLLVKQWIAFNVQLIQAEARLERIAAAGGAAGVAGRFAAAGFALGPLVGTIVSAIGLIASLVLAFVSWQESAEDTVIAQEKLNKSLDDFSEATKTAIANASIFTLLQEFQRIASVPVENRTTEEIQRFGQLATVIEQAFGRANIAIDDATRAALQAGKVNADTLNKLRDIGRVSAEELQKQADRLKEISRDLAALREASSFSIPELASGVSGGSAAREGRLAVQKALIDKLKQSLREFPDLAKIINLDDVSEGFENFQKSIRDSISALEQNAAAIQDQVQPSSDLLDRLTKLSAEEKALGQTERDRLQNSGQIAEVQKEKARLTGILADAFAKEGAAGITNARELLKVEKEKLAAATKAYSLDLAQQVVTQKLTDLGAKRIAVQKAINEAIAEGNAVKQLSLGLELAEILAEEAKTRGEDPAAATKRIAEEAAARVAAIQNAIGQALKRGGGGGGAGRSRGERDPLNDFIREIERQSGVLKKLSDLIEKQSDQIVQNRRKLLKELRDSEALPADFSLRLEQETIVQAAKLSAELTAAQQSFIDFNRKLAEAIATSTKKGKRDIRDRELEAASKLLDNDLEIFFQGIEKLRKVEDELTQIFKENATKRIEIRKKEIEALQEAVKQTSDFGQELIKIKEQFGKLTEFSSAQSQAAARSAQRDVDKNSLLLSLFPFAEPKLLKILKESLSDLADIGQQSKRSDIQAIGNASSSFLEFLSTIKKIDPSDVQTLSSIRAALVDLVKTISKELDASKLTQLDKLGSDFLRLTNNLKEIDRQLAARDIKSREAQKIKTKDVKLSDAEKQSLEARKAEIEKEIERIKEETRKIAGDIDFSEESIRRATEEAKRLGIAFAALEELTGKQSDAVEKTGGILALLREEIKDILELEFQRFKLQEKQLEAEQSILDFNINRLTTLEDLVNKQRDLGILSEGEARKRLLELNQQKIKQLEILKAVKEQILLTQQQNIFKLTGKTNINEAFALAPEAASSQLQVGQEIDEIKIKLFELKNQAIDLASPLVALRDAFGKIKDAVSSLPAPFNELDLVFEGLQQIVDSLLKRERKPFNEQVQDAGDILVNSGRNFDQRVNTAIDSAQQKINTVIDKFTKDIPEAGQAFKNNVLQGISEWLQQTFGINAGDIPSAGADAGRKIGTAIESSGAVAAKQMEEGIKKGSDDGSKKFNATAASVISAAASAISSVLSGISRGGVGGVLGGIGGALGAFSSFLPALGPIGGIISIVGGFASFFGQRARQKTIEMAKAIEEGIQVLKRRISSGAITLGQGILELEKALADASNRLRLRSGGKEELAKIEKEIREEQERLREEARKIQADFRRQLSLLREPESIRSIITSIQDAFKQAKDFIRSFSDPEELRKAIPEAVEFLRRTFEELKKTIKENIESLNKELIRAGEQFQQSERDILLRGRLDPRVSEVETKRKQLIELEREFRERQLQLQKDIKAEQEKLKAVQDREKLEEKIAKIAERTAKQLKEAADAIARAAAALARVLKLIQERGVFGNSGLSDSATSNIVIDLRINGQPVSTTETETRSNFIRQLVLRGDISASQLARFDPAR